MACGCSKKSNSTAIGGAVPVYSEVKRSKPLPTPSVRMPYTTAPSDACLLCADKHVSSACAEACTSASLWYMLGELELARRHLLGVDKGLSDMAANAMLAVAEHAEGWQDRISELSDIVQKQLESVGGAAAAVGIPVATHGEPAPSDNPLVGVVRLGAACRLVREIGYIHKNRAMAIGDLTAAAEQLTRSDANIAPLIRDLRHAVQMAIRTDMSPAWQAACEKAASLLPGAKSAAYAALLKGLRVYLGLPSEDFIPGVENVQEQS